MDAAAEFFESSSGRRRAARRAISDRRGLAGETIRRFRLGFAPDGREALSRALSTGASSRWRCCVEAACCAGRGRRRALRLFPRPGHFPDRRPRGRVIAFGGRALGEGQPKYLNSPETPLFQKGRVLYGWAAARVAAARSRGSAASSPKAIWM